MATVMYRSTRGDSRLVSAAEAIVSGIAADGGLYVLTTAVADCTAGGCPVLPGPGRANYESFLPDLAAELAAAVQ